MYQDTLPSALTCQFRSVYPLLSSSHPTFIHCIGSVHPRTHTNINNPHQLYKCSATEIWDLLSNLKPEPIQWRTQQACTLQLQSKTQIEFLSFVWVWLPRYFKICSIHRWSSSLLSLIFHSDFSIADVDCSTQVYRNIQEILTFCSFGLYRTTPINGTELEG